MGRVKVKTSQFGTWLKSLGYDEEEERKALKCFYNLDNYRNVIVLPGSFIEEWKKNRFKKNGFEYVGSEEPAEHLK